MMIVLTDHDIRRLSPACQAEIQGLLFAKTPKNAETAEEFQFDMEEFAAFGVPPEADAYAPFDEVAGEKLRETKRVIDITPEEAGALLANISDRSLRTLMRFAAGEPLPLEQLVGTGKPYENLTDLKRSFIGAVTRRLRTVTRNRSAALFLKTEMPVDGAEAIAIRALSAESLRAALRVSEQIQPEE